MQAVAIDAYGPASSLSVREMEKPTPGQGQILVRVHYASINPVDWKIRRGDIRLLLGNKFPRVIGVDFAGEVSEVGSGVSKYKPGDRIFGMCNPLRTQYGSYAEFALAEERDVALRPAELTEEQAVSLPVAGLTALKALRQHIGLQPGNKVLINGASGGVGSFAVQIAKADGARVSATCSAPNIQFVQSLGADEVYDYATQDVASLDGQFNGILDASAKLSFASVKHRLIANGAYVTTVPDKRSVLPILLSKVFPGKKAKLVMAGSGANVSQELNDLAQLVIAGRIRPVISKVSSLSEVGQIHEIAERGHTRGKIVVIID
jgi:NADPH:quinone reductase-like Zn-dependent oxidoreductase